MRYSLPFFFHSEPTPLLRLLCYVLLCAALMLFDTQLHALFVLREGLGTLTHSIQRVTASPVQWVNSVSDAWSNYLTQHRSQEQQRQQQQLLVNTLRQARVLEQENKSLRELLMLRERWLGKGITGSILSETDDPFVRRIVIDLGRKQGVSEGNPVMDNEGIIGQITRVFASTAEVTLLTDHDQAIPIKIMRQGLRAVAFGGTDGEHLELRFLSNNADVIVGDEVVTSGIDGVYFPGIAVGIIKKIIRDEHSDFAQIIVKPAARIHYNQNVWVMTALPPPIEKPDNNSPAPTNK